MVGSLVNKQNPGMYASLFLLLLPISFRTNEENLKGYWGIKVDTEKTTWEKFPPIINFAKVKLLWNTIFYSH